MNRKNVCDLELQECPMDTASKDLVLVDGANMGYPVKGSSLPTPGSSVLGNCLQDAVALPELRGLRLRP